MKNYKDYDICRKALENEIILGNYNKKKSLKIVIYIFFLAIFNSYKIIDRKIYIVNGKSEKRFSIPQGYEAIYYSNVNKNILDYRHLTTYMSGIKKKERLKILLKACVCYFEVKKYKIPFGYYLDYQYWKNLFEKSKINIVLSNGHYDRLTTQIAYICKESNIRFIIKQHGILSKTIQIQNRIPADEVLSFNENEIEKFKNNIIDGECKYKQFFQTSVKFVTNAKSRSRIGIIEQPINVMDRIIDLVLEIFKNSEVLVMVHPLSKNDYSKYIKNEDVKFSNEDKEWNLDLIVATASTLVYEYVGCGFKKPIYVLDEANDFQELSKEYNNIVVCSSIAILKQYLLSANSN